MSDRKKFSLDKRDPIFIEKLIPLLSFFYEKYFRVEANNTDNIPKKPALFVGNHNGILGCEIFMLIEMARRHFPVEQKNILGLTHSIALNEPMFNWLPKIGSIHANQENALLAFEHDYSLLVYPGGDRDAFRSWWKRSEVDFGGRVGYAELALKAGVPIVPVANIGAHEQSFIFHRSDYLAELFTLKEKYRITALPLTPSAMPFFPGLFVPALQDLSFKAMIAASAIPLPAKMEFYFEGPIELNKRQKQLSFKRQVKLLDELVRASLTRRLKIGYGQKRIPLWGKI